MKERKGEGRVARSLGILVRNLRGPFRHIGLKSLKGCLTLIESVLASEPSSEYIGMIR